MRSTDCNLTITNNLSSDIRIENVMCHILDWHNNDPHKKLNGIIVNAKNTFKTKITSEDEYARCWFEYNAKPYANGKAVDDKMVIGMTHIELKPDDTRRQVKRETRTEYYTHEDVKVSVSIEIKVPTTGEYTINITYSPL